MTYAFYYDAPGDERIYHAISAAIGDEPAAGLIVHVVTKTGSGLRHLNVWESREQWLRFHEERVAPALEAVLTEMGIPAPAGSPEVHQLQLVDVGVARSGQQEAMHGS